MKRTLLITFLALISALAVGRSATYAGQEHREIKALSPAQVQDYLSGKGMGLARAAELNGYPGPKHVLDLAEELELTPEQRRESATVFERMHEAAVHLGRRIVERERELDWAFASGNIDSDRLRRILEDIGDLQADLRVVHLAAHLQQRAILGREQVRTYRRLRGYTGDAARPSRDHHGH